MVQLTRKQREIQERDHLILRVSRQLFIERGYHNVTMDMIAHEVEYSKGTIYQHYNNKEQIISKLCLHFSQMLLHLFSYVNTVEECPQYLKMQMLLEIENTIHRRARSDHALVKLVKAEAFTTKLDEASVHEMNCHVELVLKQVLDIVTLAIKLGELQLVPGSSAMSIALGCWALIEGTFDIVDVHAHENTGLKPAQVEAVLQNNCVTFLRGSGWHAMPIDEAGNLNLCAENTLKLNEFKKYCQQQLNKYHSE